MTTNIIPFAQDAEELGDAGNVEAGLAKEGPYEPLRSYPEFRDLLPVPGPAGHPGGQARPAADSAAVPVDELMTWPAVADVNVTSQIVSTLTWVLPGPRSRLLVRSMTLVESAVTVTAVLAASNFRALSKITRCLRYKKRSPIRASNSTGWLGPLLRLHVGHSSWRLSAMFDPPSASGRI